jgi:hypothetical protein
MLLRRGIGRVSIDQDKAFAAQDARFVRPYVGARIMTTREVLHEEAEMLKIVEAGRDRYEELGRGGSWEPTSQPAHRPGLGRDESRRPGQDGRPGNCQRTYESFSQANEAQFYVSLSRAREAVHLFTDSKVALKEAVTKPSGRLSPLELIMNSANIAPVRGASEYLRTREAEQLHHQAPAQAQESTMER